MILTDFALRAQWGCAISKAYNRMQETCLLTCFVYIALSSTSPSKRKVEQVDVADAENVDPLLFSKRAKSGKSSSPKDGVVKPSNFILTSKPAPVKPLSISASAPSLTPARRFATPKSPAAKLSSGVKSTVSLTTPAGRSPTRAKRAGLLGNSRRRTLGRVDPPSFGPKHGAGHAAPFSLDAALKGTIPSYASRPSTKPAKPVVLVEPEMNASWFFDIHEDTPEQEMTNMLQHSTCTLDISSDEESEQRARRESKENKENVAPADDISQTTSARTTQRLREEDEMIYEKQRVALGEMDVTSFYPTGCDSESVIYIPGDEPDARPSNLSSNEPESASKPEAANLAATTTSEAKQESDFDIEEDVDALMQQKKHVKSKLSQELEPDVESVLEPIEGTGENFELWESTSAKDDEQTSGDAVASS